MTTVFGVFGPQSFVVLLVALIGLVPVVLYFKKTSRWFILPYLFLFIAAFATNFEDVLLPEVLNFTEHLVGNLGAGIAFALAAYMYRQQSITADDTQSEVEV